jgi:hypothetical protein
MCRVRSTIAAWAIGTGSDTVAFTISGHVTPWNRQTRQLWIDDTPLYVPPAVEVPYVTRAQSVWARVTGRRMSWSGP